MKKKKTVKTRILSLFLILLLLTGSVSGVHAQEEADMGAAGNETTKEQIVESGDSSGSGEQGSVPESTESTDGSADVKKDEETSSGKNVPAPAAVKKEAKAITASDEENKAASAGEAEKNKAKTGVGLTATLRVDGYGKSVLYPTNVTLPDTYKPLVGEDGYGFTEEQVGEDPGYYTPLHLMAQYCVNKGITPSEDTKGIDIEGGWLKNFLGAKSELDTFFMFEVNNICPNDGHGNLYTFVNCPLSSGDNIVVYDWYWSENSAYAYFAEENINASVNTPFTVTLKSNNGMGEGAAVCSAAEVLVQDEKGNVLSADDYQVNDKTDEKGNAKVTIKETGTYLLTAERKNLDGKHELNRPYAKVTVGLAPVMTDEEAVKKAKEELSIEGSDKVGDCIYLPDTGTYGTNVMWKLKNEEDKKYIATSDGNKWQFYRPVKDDAPLTFIATIVKGDYRETKEIILNLKGKVPKIEGITVSYGALKFNPEVKNYELYVPKEIEKLKVTVTHKECPLIWINGQYDFLSPEIQLNESSTIITIEGQVSSSVQGDLSVYKDTVATITVKRPNLGTPLPELPDITWGQHLGDKNNNAVVDFKATTGTGELLWESFSQAPDIWGYGTRYAGTPILVNGYIYIVQNDEIVILNAKTGVREKSTKLSEKIGMSSNIIYGGGMIFVPLGDGSIQVFNAKTLQSMYLLDSPAPFEINYSVNGAMHYENGKLYVGFSDGSTLGCYAVYDTMDIDIENETEVITPLWTSENSEGQSYYGAGAVTIEDKLVIAGDGGIVYVYNSATGEKISSLQLEGAVRGSIVYAEGYIWVATKGNKIYKLSINESGQLIILAKGDLLLETNASPVVASGKVYITGGDFKNGGFLAVYDKDLKLLAKEKTEFMLNTPTVTTAYDDTYVYFTENGPEGNLYMAKVTANNKITLKKIYTPKHIQYSMSKVIISSDGTIYYTNDAGYLFAIRTKTSQKPIAPNDNTAGATPSLKPDKKSTATVSAQSFAPRKRTMKVNAATKNNASSESHIVNAIQESYDKKETSLTIKNPPEVVGAEVFARLAQYPEFRLVFDCGTYTLSMKGSDVTNVNATLTTKLLELENTLPKEEAEKYGNYQQMVYAQAGPLPAKITVVYKLGEQFERSEALYLYDLSQSAEAQEVILQESYGMFVLENGGEFILSDQKIEEAKQAEVMEISEEIKPVNEKTTSIPVWVYLLIGLGAGALISGLITVKVMNTRKRNNTWEE